MVAAEGRTRRILKDIGNLVPDQAVEGKHGPQPPDKNKVTLVNSVILFHINIDSVKILEITIFAFYREQSPKK